MEQGTLRRINAGPIRSETQILSVTTYVRHVTAAATEGRSWRCQGLHSDTFLPYGSLQVDRLAAACHRSLRWAFNCCRPAGRTNAPTADHAWAWFQRTDRLETARDRREPSHHRLRDHDAVPYPQGRRHPRDPDCADRNTPPPPPPPPPRPRPPGPFPSVP